MQDATTRGWFVIGLFFVAELGVLHASVEFWFGRRRGRPQPRLSNMSARVGLFAQLTLVGLLAWTFLHGLWSPEDVGLQVRAPWASCCAGGGAWLFFQRIAPHLLQRPSSSDWIPATLAHARACWPRGRWGKVARVLTLTINPATEELVMRGFFVKLLATLSSSVVLAVCVGLALCLVMHAYQGTRNLLFHAAFFGVVTVLTFSWAGLLAAIVMHLCADLAPAMQAAGNVKRIRAWRAQRMKRAHVANGVANV